MLAAGTAHRSLPRSPPTLAPSQVALEMVFRVRRVGGSEADYTIVGLVPTMTPMDVEKMVALAVDYEVGTIGLRKTGRVEGFHAGLDGDWDVALVRLPAGACL